MTDMLTQFNVQMTNTMKSFQNRFDVLNAKATQSAEHAEKEIRSQITVLEESGQKAKSSLEAAKTELTKWVDDPTGTVVEWKKKFEAGRLAERADRTARYAEAASQVATASVEQAEKAILASKLARLEADTAKAAKVKAA